MRWKLLIIAALAATIVGACASLALSYGLMGTTERIRTPDLTAIAILAIPVAAITAATIFVYRHTARRRPLQAAMTAMLSILLTLIALVAGTLALAANRPDPFKSRPTRLHVD